MKRTMTVFVILALCATLLAGALPLAWAAEEAAKPVTVAYDQLSELIIAGSPEYQKDLQEIKKLELSIGAMKSQLDDMNKAWSLYIQQIIPLQDSLKTAEDRLADLQDALDGKVTQRVNPAQKLYLNHYILSLDVALAQRALSAAEKDLSAAQQKLARGMVTQSVVNNAEKSVKNQRDAVKTAKTKVDDNLEALAKSLGLSAPIALDGLPDIDLKRITERDLKADLAAYIPATTVSAAKAVESAEDTYDKSKSSTNWYAYTVAVQDLDKAKKDAEQAFPKVYQTLRDAYDDYIDSTAVSDARKEYEKDQTRFARGMIAQNTLLSTERTLRDAENRWEQQRIRVILSLMEYEYNLIKF